MPVVKLHLNSSKVSDNNNKKSSNVSESALRVEAAFIINNVLHINGPFWGFKLI